MNAPSGAFKFSGGEGGIRTHVGRLCPHPISSRRRYDRFGTSPRAAYSIQTLKALLTLVAILLLGTCSQPPPLLEQILAGGELKVATRNSPDAYYLGSQGPEGPAYELASRFAENLGVPLRLYTVRTREDAINEVRAGRAHLAAAGLAHLDIGPGENFRATSLGDLDCFDHVRLFLQPR